MDIRDWQLIPCFLIAEMAWLVNNRKNLWDPYRRHGFALLSGHFIAPVRKTTWAVRRSVTPVTRFAVGRKVFKTQLPPAYRCGTMGCGLPSGVNRRSPSSRQQAEPCFPLRSGKLGPARLPCDSRNPAPRCGRGTMAREGRVDPDGYPSRPPTDPDMRN